MTRRKKILAAGIVLIVLAALGLHYKQRDSFTCASCASRRHLFQWRLGIWRGPSIPLSGSRERIDSSALYVDFPANGHEHDWKFSQGSPYNFFGTVWGGCALGSGARINFFCRSYEMKNEFRQFISDKVARGELSRDTIVRIAALPSLYDKDAPADTEKAKLMTLAENLLLEVQR